jgi:hyperosmotically inducible periplasmic protein
MSTPYRRKGILAFVLAGFFGWAVLPARTQEPQQPAPDNSKANQRDRDKSSDTADRQKTSPEDRELAKKIRSAIVADKSLSTYAHNVKILARDGKVTLKGPVRSEEEKTALIGKAAGIAGEGNVMDQMDVAPPKSQP